VAVQLSVDLGAWWVGLAFAMMTRYDFHPSRVIDGGWAAIAIVACAVHVLFGVPLGLYRRRWSFGSFEEVAGLVRTGLVTTAIVFAVNFVTGPVHWVPASAPLGGGWRPWC
jgi:FlaA1/EpsC-like NDP-sugar epimerase